MSMKPNEPLDADHRADAVTKRILLDLLDAIEANVEGARLGADSECLHDLRVATRRTRSVLGQIKEVFPADVTRLYRERFAWLQRVTGPVRDLDVYLLSFDDYRDSLSPSLRPWLEPWREWLIARREHERRTLIEWLDSSEFQTLRGNWRDFLSEPVPDQPVARNAARSIKSLADERIRRLAKRVRREGRAIGSESPATDLHELRKSCKKLRYLMEFMAPLYPDEEIRPLIKTLKRLLDWLGAHQDLAVQTAHLQEMAEDMRHDTSVATGALLAMGALIANLAARQRAARDGFAEVFATFDKPEQWRRYKALFWSSGADAG